MILDIGGGAATKVSVPILTTNFFADKLCDSAANVSEACLHGPLQCAKYNKTSLPDVRSLHELTAYTYLCMQGHRSIVAIGAYFVAPVG